MTREEIVAAIDEEISRLEKVRSLLQGSGGSKLLASGALAGARKKRQLSPDARRFRGQVISHHSRDLHSHRLRSLVGTVLSSGGFFNIDRPGHWYDSFR